MYPMNQSYQQLVAPRRPDGPEVRLDVPWPPSPTAPSLRIGTARCEMETIGRHLHQRPTGHGIFVSQSDYGMF